MSKPTKQFHPAPIMAGVGTFLMLIWLNQSGWTIIGGTAFIAFATWYAISYKPEADRY